VEGEPSAQDESALPRAIVTWSWATTGVFTAVAVPVALGASALEGVAIAVSLALFAASLVVWAYAFGLAVVRSSRGDDISVPTLFFLSSGSAPVGVRRQLLGSLALSVVIAIVTVKANPFSALVPMLTLGLTGLWAARHGTFPSRPAARGSRSPRSRSPASRRSDGRPGQ
jgi:hypothetical protein